MSSLTEPELKSMKSSEIDSTMRTVLGRVFVNMPWSYMGRFMDLVLENSMNVEIGFTGADLQSCSPVEIFGSRFADTGKQGGESPFMGLFGT